MQSGQRRLEKAVVHHSVWRTQRGSNWRLVVRESVGLHRNVEAWVKARRRLNERKWTRKRTPE
jgi:hypothetical protein